MKSLKDKSLASLIKEADEHFRRYIQKRDEGKPCFICGNPIPKGEAELCHFIPRANLMTRWSQAGCHLGCVTCNRFDTAHSRRYEEAILKAYGPDRLNSLQWWGHSLLKPMRSDIQEIIDSYKQKIKEL